MATYAIKHGGQLITQLYYEATAVPQIGDVLSLQPLPDRNFDASMPFDAPRKAYKVVSIDMSGMPTSEMGHHGGDPEPTIYVEPV